MINKAKDHEYDWRLPPKHESPPDKHLHQEQFPDGTYIRHCTVDKECYTEVSHASGASVHIRNDGTITVHTANNFILYSKGGTTITLDNHGDIKVHGHLRVNVDTDAHIVFGKNLSFAVGGMLDIYSGGHTKIAATDIGLQSTAGSIVSNAERDVEMRAENGRIAGHSNGVTTFTTNTGDFHVDAGGMVQTTSQLDTEINSMAEINTNSSDDTNITAGGTLKEVGHPITMNP